MALATDLFYFNRTVQLPVFLNLDVWSRRTLPWTDHSKYRTMGGTLLTGCIPEKLTYTHRRILDFCWTEIPLAICAQWMSWILAMFCVICYFLFRQMTFELI